MVKKKKFLIFLLFVSGRTYINWSLNPPYLPARDGSLESRTRDGKNSRGPRPTYPSTGLRRYHTMTLYETFNRKKKPPPTPYGSVERVNIERVWIRLPSSRKTGEHESGGSSRKLVKRRDELRKVRRVYCPVETDDSCRDHGHRTSTVGTQVRRSERSQTRTRRRGRDEGASWR